MIPNSKYKSHNGIPYITEDQIKEHHTALELSNFKEWFQGQTAMLVPDEGCGIYVSDYERWVVGGMLNKQGSYWD